MIWYCISGLGADRRVFSFLKLNDEVKYLDWIDPFPNERIQDYAKRLASSIDQSRDYGLLGVSLGGVVALEMLRFMTPVRVVIVSSGLLKWRFRNRLSRMGVNLIGIKKMKPPRFIMKMMFKPESKESETLLFKIIEDTAPHFLNWALKAIVSHRLPEHYDTVVQILGEDDYFFDQLPGSLSCFKIESGNHFMIVDRSDEISKIINTLK